MDEGFYVRYDGMVHQLSPHPESVQYPAEALTITHTQDGAAIIQRPMVDQRLRRWTWRNWPLSDEAYSELWTLLRSLRASERMANGLGPTVELWENVSGGPYGETLGSFPEWTPVRIVRVEREPRRGGGPVIFDETWVEWIPIE